MANKGLHPHLGRFHSTSCFMIKLSCVDLRWILHIRLPRIVLIWFQLSDRIASRSRRTSISEARCFGLNKVSLVTLVTKVSLLTLMILIVLLTLIILATFMTGVSFRGVSIKRRLFVDRTPGHFGLSIDAWVAWVFSDGFPVDMSGTKWLWVYHFCQNGNVIRIMLVGVGGRMMRVGTILFMVFMVFMHMRCWYIILGFGNSSDTLL
mmetsp:Transcript_23992/g.58652  ORF Transcript_23992/g.58652 Transcript_23992/m.58652 type:complete len:207 (+) Transcript_23992:877-1497(+)